MKQIQELNALVGDAINDVAQKGAFVPVGSTQTLVKIYITSFMEKIIFLSFKSLIPKQV